MGGKTKSLLVQGVRSGTEVKVTIHRDEDGIRLTDILTKFNDGSVQVNAQIFSENTIE